MQPRRTTWAGLVLVWLSLLALIFGAPTAQAAVNTNTIPVGGTAGVVFDLTSGKVLAAKDAATPHPLASLTKIVSLYLIRDAVAHGRLSWTDTATPTAAEVKLSKDTNLSNVPLAEKAYTVKELYDAGWVYSANVAVMLLASRLAGSQQAFIKEMQEHLATLGIRDATLYTTSGLNNSLLPESMRVSGTPADGENKMSAADIGVVVRHLLQTYPDVLQDTQVVHKNFAVTASQTYAMTNWNALLTGNSLAQSDLPVDGLKTGTSDLAGQCLVATMPWQNRRLVSVLLHANGAETDDTKRFVQTAALLRAVNQAWRPVTLNRQNAAKQKVKVTDGKQASTTLQLTKSVVGWAYQGQVVTPVRALPKTAALSAPVVKGRPAASTTLTKDTLGYLPQTDSQEISLAPTKSVAKLNFFERFLRWLGQLF